MKRTSRLDIPVLIVLVCAAGLVGTVLVGVLENTAKYPVVGVLSALALIGLVGFLAFISLKG